MVTEFSVTQRTVNYITGEKLCVTCKNYKPVSDFNKRVQRGKWVYREQCKSCEGERLKSNSTRKTEWLEEKMSELACTCGNNDIRVLDLHHTDPSKKNFNISRLIGSGGYSLEHLKKEFLKCIAICSNCHRTLHSEENKDWRWRAHQRKLAKTQQA